MSFRQEAEELAFKPGTFNSKAWLFTKENLYFSYNSSLFSFQAFAHAVPSTVPGKNGGLALERKDNYSSKIGRKVMQWVKTKRKLEKAKGKAREPRSNSFDFLMNR